LREDLNRLLIEKHSATPETAQTIANMANGSCSRAVEMIQGNWVNKRNWLIGEMETLGTKAPGTIMAFAEKLSKDKASLMDSLEILTTWFRDVLIYKFSPRNITNRDMMHRIESAAERFSVDTLHLNIKHIQQTQRDINANANVRLSLDTLVFRLAKG
jgi:DNA polymerase-3 subunit delta'